MADTLRRMLESGELTEEECISVLRGLVSDKVVGGCTSEKKVIEEKAVKRLNKRKSLTQLLDMRDPESDLRRCYDEEADEEEWQPVDERYHRQLRNSQFFDIDRDVRIPSKQGISPFYFGEKEEEEQPPPEMDLYGRLGVHWFNFEHNRNLKFIRIPKLNTEHPYSVSYYITIEVEDVDAAAAGGSSPSSLTLQTLVSRPFFPRLEIMIERCRIKPTIAKAEPHSFLNHFSIYGVHEFYKGPMPTTSPLIASLLQEMIKVSWWSCRCALLQSLTRQNTSSYALCRFSYPLVSNPPPQLYLQS